MSGSLPSSKVIRDGGITARAAAAIVAAQAGSPEARLRPITTAAPVSRARQPSRDQNPLGRSLTPGWAGVPAGAV